MAEGYGQVWQIEGTGYHGDREINKCRAFGCEEEEDNKCMNKSRILHNRTKIIAGS
jgi:hypothetical protein